LAVAHVSPSRALREPRRIDWRAAFGIVVTLAATGGSLLFWSTSSDTRGVLVATRDLPAGAVLGASDLAAARLRMDDAIYRAAIPVAELGQVVGKQLAEPVHPQQVLVRPQLAARPPLAPDQGAMTIPIAPETAGGHLHPGDAVAVLVTVAKGKPESRTVVVLPRVAVYDVGYDDRAAVVNADATAASADLGAASKTSRGAPTSVTLSLSSDQTLQLAQARWNGDIDLVLLPPAQPSQASQASQPSP
jgi:Flp pilus assembly protein CpaB